MKILRITESQYKRLVKTKRLNEGIIFNNPEDEKDLTPEITKFLDYLSDVLLSTTNKDLFIKNIENGIVYIDETMYDEEDEKIISEFIDFWVFETIFKNDKKIDSFTYDSGLDYDYEDVTVLFKCYCEDNETGETIEYICGEEIPENCKKDDDDSENRIEIDDSRLYTPTSTGNHFRKSNSKLYGKKGHSGHDYHAKNKSVVFMKDGLVKSAFFNNDSCGGTITIVPKGENRKAIFCHMSEIYVEKDENIKAGTVIGVTGGGVGQKGSGHSTGHHLHFGMKNKSSGGKYIDPNDYTDDFKLIK